MPEYEYRAARGGGPIEQGTLSAPTEQVALRQLRSLGLTPVRISEVGTLRAAQPVVAVPDAIPARRSAPFRRSGVGLRCGLIRSIRRYQFRSRSGWILRMGTVGNLLCPFLKGRSWGRRVAVDRVDLVVGTLVWVIFFVEC